MTVQNSIAATHCRQDVQNEITCLVNLHGVLLKSIRSLNIGFGLPILFAVLSCLLHLIITGYFAYIEIRDENCSWRIFTMQILWIIFHTMGMLIIVQPCYWCIMLNKETGNLVCKLLTLKNKPSVSKRLEIFSLQVLYRPLEFSVCGLFFLDRHLCTSIAAAVTTYLVILLQFQSKGDEN
ncbi:gustatory receptor for sugar taste 43a-like [Leptopilina boulardi]|uniref:gustatory receptor for sugar taste 43a-like n=1 Tax=Leptopilina boulardi TaxID=63433 RepID=UPI0021F61F59|nr:gustatory receptor for sugar taste 43a-like [Leptopilina boulardi]